MSIEPATIGALVAGLVSVTTLAQRAIKAWMILHRERTAAETRHAIALEQLTLRIDRWLSSIVYHHKDD